MVDWSAPPPDCMHWAGSGPPYTHFANPSLKPWLALLEWTFNSSLGKQRRYHPSTNLLLLLRGAWVEIAKTSPIFFCLLEREMTLGDEPAHSLVNHSWNPITGSDRSYCPRHSSDAAVIPHFCYCLGVVAPDSGQPQPRPAGFVRGKTSGIGIHNCICAEPQLMG
jgi:hypothetical protein